MSRVSHSFKFLSSILLISFLLLNVEATSREFGVKSNLHHRHPDHHGNNDRQSTFELEKRAKSNLKDSISTFSETSLKQALKGSKDRTSQKDKKKNPVDRTWLETQMANGLKAWKEAMVDVDMDLSLDTQTEAPESETTESERDCDDEEELAKRATNGTIDYAALVNNFIGTGATNNPGNVFPGASVPFGMAKIGIDLDGVYAPAGYTDQLDAPVRGMSILHDTGTGSSSGSFGNFESMPIVCKNDNFQACPTALDPRGRARKAGTDKATPGYFSTSLNNSIQMEATSTRRAGLIRYTFPQSYLSEHKSKPHVVIDASNDLPGTWRGGNFTLDAEKGRFTVGGNYGSSFGSGLFTYQAYACFDLLNDGKQKLGSGFLWQADRFGQDSKLKVEGISHANLTRNTIGGQPVQTGALVSFADSPKTSDGDSVITLRVGVSYVSRERACQNAESEIPEWNFNKVRKESRAKWNEKLSRLEISTKTDDTITELLYSSFYRQFLSPNNATQETQGLYAGTNSPYFDGLYCTWDTFRTFYPLLALHSPQDFADIVENYVDGWRKSGVIPECRANMVPGLTQGGSDATSVLANFALAYHKKAKKLGVNMKDLYDALVSDAYVTPAEWDQGGRQVGVYMEYGYIPFTVFDTYSTGRQTRELSRTSEYSHNDFAVRNVALLRGDKAVAADMSKRALYYRNNFDNSSESLGYNTFLQQRYPDGSFNQQDPTFCSPIDTNGDHSCSLQQENTFGVYETSSWEYSLFAPHDTQGLIDVLAGGSKSKFIKRVDSFFDNDLFYPGNEPSFQAPVIYHYADAPTRSVDRVREVVFKNFNTTNAGLPGNDDNGAMATLLLFHLLGIYPVPGSNEYLIVSPFLPSYTINNAELGKLTVTAKNFDNSTLAEKIPSGARAYVNSVSINGVKQSSRCKIQFEQLFPGNNAHTKVVLEMTSDKKAANSCGSSDKDLPSSLSTGGFDY